jgi:serine/threonine-protein kinase
MPDTEILRKLLLQWDENTAFTAEELCRPYSDRPDHDELLQAVRDAIANVGAVAPFGASSTSVSSDSWRTAPPMSVSKAKTDPAVFSAAIAEPPAGLRYRPVAPHRQGGLGEVLIADDAELHRRVALKRIRVDRRHDSSSHREFLREAEITARLEHPGIVPVHGLVHDADGQPYYAMRFIEGETLSDAIKRFHEADKDPKRDPGERSLALRELLHRFIAVCNTIAYAHSRGVLHRDLKPQNVMLGKYGETLVVDWGLAKPFERSEEAKAAGEETVRPSATRQEEYETRPGDVKGTPAYMSPEQASGRIDEMGQASDIFALGATLYALLTRTAPYHGSDALARAKRAEFPTPRQVKPQVHPALEAICLKAMKPKPTDRYATAKALADDVEKWLADQPLSAHRESLLDRLRRWMRRHRAAVGSAVAALVVALIATTVGLFVLRAAESRERGLRETADDEKVKAETSRKEAIEALRVLTDDIVEKAIAAKASLGAAEKQFLEKALVRWQKFASVSGENEQARAIRAEGEYRVAFLRAYLGQLDDALSGFQKAIAEWNRLVEDFPTEPRHREEWPRVIMDQAQS